MSTLKETLAKLNGDERMSAAVDRLKRIINLYNQAQHIHPQLQDDIFTIVNSSLELAEMTLDEHYSADRVLASSGDVLVATRNLMMHIETYRPTTKAFGLQRLDTFVILPQIYNSSDDARRAIETFRSMGMTTELRVIEVKLSATTVSHPNRPKSKTPPPLPLHPPANEPLDAVG